MKMDSMKKSCLFLAHMRYILLGIIILESLIGCNMPTDKDSKDAILSIQNDSYDYWFEDDQKNVRVLNSQVKKITTGNRMSGYFYDETLQTQYKDGEIITLTDSDMTYFDNLASQYIDNICFVLNNQDYNAYSDSRYRYKDNYYYFAISKEGLKRFGNEYSKGRLTAYYKKGVFLYADITLFTEGIERPVIRFVFGKIDYVPIMPKQGVNGA